MAKPPQGTSVNVQARMAADDVLVLDRLAATQSTPVSRGTYIKFILKQWIERHRKNLEKSK